jgi:hypothetical protein
MSQTMSAPTLTNFEKRLAAFTPFERNLARRREPLSKRVLDQSWLPVKKPKKVAHSHPWDFEFQNTYGNKFNTSLHRDMRQYFGVHNLSESMLAEVAAHRMLKNKEIKCHRCWSPVMGEPSSASGVYPLHPDNDRRGFL